VTPTRVTAFAPASVANVAIGFDILGFSVDALGDRVTLKRVAQPGVIIKSIGGVVQDLPREADRNTAGQALLALVAARQLAFGFEMQIEKGIPLASGTGGICCLGGGGGGGSQCHAR
jgi:homoserine kinase